MCFFIQCRVKVMTSQLNVHMQAKSYQHYIKVSNQQLPSFINVRIQVYFNGHVKKTDKVDEMVGA